MHKKLLSLVLVLALFVACGKKEEKTEVNESKAEIVKVSVDEFNEKAVELANKEIEISGTIVHVCKHGGKKAQIIGTNPDVKVQLKCTDEVSNFEREAEGSEVVATGIVDILVIDEAYLNNWEAEVEAKSEKEALKKEAPKENKNCETEDADHESKESILKQINAMREQVKASEKGRLEYYSVKLTNFKIIEAS